MTHHELTFFTDIRHLMTIIFYISDIYVSLNKLGRACVMTDKHSYKFINTYILRINYTQIQNKYSCSSHKHWYRVGNESTNSGLAVIVVNHYT